MLHIVAQSRNYQGYNKIHWYIAKISVISIVHPNIWSYSYRSHTEVWAGSCHDMEESWHTIGSGMYHVTLLSAKYQTCQLRGKLHFQRQTLLSKISWQHLNLNVTYCNRLHAIIEYIMWRHWGKAGKVLKPRPI